MKEYLVFDNGGKVPFRFLINEYLLYTQNKITEFELKHSNLSITELKTFIGHQLSRELTETIFKTINFEIVDEFNPKTGKEFTIRAGINYEAKLFEKEKIELRKERDFLNEFEKSLKKYHLDIVKWQNNINSSENLFTSLMTFFIICSTILMVLIIAG